MKNYNIVQLFIYLFAGLLLYFLSGFIFFATGLPAETVAATYIGVTITGFILVLTGGGLLSRIIKKNYPPTYLTPPTKVSRRKNG